ncbi:MAG TPA: NmrA family NAD(P)-binding protein [Egibacteraceae bacterium]|nr:NmrA family NAD(P)-binding protein [Egibacteraceae bacterium]
MGQSSARVVAVVGTTGMQGGVVTRRLLRDGWAVRALTRTPASKKARAVAALGAEVVRADTNESRDLDRAFEGAHGVYNVQNHHLSGYDGEVAQARNVAAAAARAGVRHVVYGSAGFGRAGTGVGSWETKVEAADYMRAQDLPVTILRPTAFMELMTERKFFPPASAWKVMPELMGEDRPVLWLAVEDLAVIAAMAFADPDRFVGQDLSLAADVQSIGQCRAIWLEETGRAPRRLPLPVGLFERFVGVDETTMWRWLRDHDYDLDTRPTRTLHPHALTVRQWLRVRRGQPADPPEPPASKKERPD